MQKRKSILALIIIIFLSGCSASKMVEQRYPDRMKYSFKDPSTNMLNTYLCKDVGGDLKTKKQAHSAHLYLIKRLDEITKASVKEMIDNKSSTFMSVVKSQYAMQKKVTVVAKEIESKYQCVLTSAE